MGYRTGENQIQSGFPSFAITLTPLTHTGPEPWTCGTQKGRHLDLQSRPGFRGCKPPNCVMGRREAADLSSMTFDFMITDGYPFKPADWGEGLKGVAQYCRFCPCFWPADSFPRGFHPR